MKEKGEHKRTDDIINSLDGIHRAMPAEDVFDKIMRRVSGVQPAAKIISLQVVSAVAAGLALLIVLNLAVLGNAGNKQAGKDPVLEVVNYYGLADNPYGI